jgi:RecB family exonuclease
MAKKEKVRLSASKIKTLDTCSWLFYSKYFLKTPDTSNDGASRGTIIHLIFELLLKPKHKKKYFDKLKKSPTAILKCKPLSRLLTKHTRRLNVNDKDNLALIYQMLYVGFNHNFYCKGNKDLKEEEHFEIEGENFVINGFIDKKAFYKNKIDIWDYKSSKAKFNKEEIESNYQALMYSLATLKSDGMIPNVKFLFLRFPDSPEQAAPKLTEDELEGFEMFLTELAELLSDYDEDKALENMAKNGYKYRWLCGSDKPGKWICPVRKPFEFYALVDKRSQKILKGAHTEAELKAGKGQEIVTKQYEGCPAWNNSAQLGNKPVFDFSGF